jgi:type I restriction enzyme S subunit
MNKDIKDRIDKINNGIVPEGYKKTKLGILPSDWKIKYMKDLFDFKNGVNAGKEKYGSGVKFINTLEVLNNNSISYSDIKGSVEVTKSTLEKNAVRKGDVLFNRTSETAEEIAKAAVYTGEKTVIFGGFIIRATEKSDCFNINYKKYAFNSNLVRKEFKKRGQGISRINIGQNELGSVPIAIFSKKEQQKIAEILMTWDEFIKNKEKLLKENIEIRKGLMYKLLSEEERLEGFQGKWNEDKLGNKCQIKTGSLDANEEVKTGEFPFFTCSKKVSRIDFHDFDTEALLIAGNGDVGHVKYYKGKFNAYQRTYVLDEFTPNIHFMKFYLEFKLPKRIYKTMHKGSMPYIKKSTLAKMKIKLPLIEEQKAIAKVLLTQDKLIEKIEKEIDLLKKQKKGLMELLLTGKIRVDEVYK